MKRESVKGNGWCLVRAVLGDVDESELVRKINDFVGYVRANINKYIDYLGRGWEREMEMHVKDKKWDTDFVDNMPKMLTDWLKKSIMVVVFEEGRVGGVSVFNVEVGEGIAIALKGGHYWRLKFDEKKLKESMKEDWRKATIVFTSLGEKCDKKVRKIFERAGLDCNVSFGAEKLYSMTRSQSKKVKTEDEMKEKGVVYEMACLECEKEGKQVWSSVLGMDSRYIGETGRELGTRVQEHLRLNKDKIRDTEVAKHGMAAHE